MAVASYETDAVALGDELAPVIAKRLHAEWITTARLLPALSLRSFLLPGYLELDLSFVGVTTLRAFEPRWRVLLDKTGEVDQAMRTESPRAATADRVQFRHLAACGEFWFGVKALRRSEFLHALSRLDGLRAHLTALAAIRELGVEYNAAQRADSLSRISVERLSALTASPDALSLRRAFATGLNTLREVESELRPTGLSDYVGLIEWLSAKHIGYLADKPTT